MVDMGQADSTLRQKPRRMQHKMCWTRALVHAAKSMGYPHYMDVPDAQIDSLKSSARKIQIEHGDA